MNEQVASQEVEILRDEWGTPHIFAQEETAGFFGMGYACAEDRLLQMDLLRRRTHGRLAEVFGNDCLGSDRKFRTGGLGQHCAEAFANLPADLQVNLRAYAAGVNAYMQSNSQVVRKRFAALDYTPEPWHPSDCLAAWMGHAEMFDVFVDDRTFWTYPEVGPEEAADPVLEELRHFQHLMATVGEAAAFEQRGRYVDDSGAVVPEAEMAKNQAVYARLKQMKHSPGFRVRGVTPQSVRFSHAWVVGGERSVTGKPILECDPQAPVNNPSLLYEMHLVAGRYDVRGIVAPGSPGMLVGFNRAVGWGATALGTGGTINFLERLGTDPGSFMWRGEALPFERRLEHIEVRGSEPVVQEVLTNHHGFVFNSLARRQRPGEAYVSHYRVAHEKGTSLRALLEWMRAGNCGEFREAMQHFYSPGANMIYADTDGNIAYQALACIPLTKRSRRWMLEGWTGEDEILGRIPLDELPNMLNPDAHVIFSANHMPVGSWYPYDLGLVGSTGEGPRAMRLRQLLAGDDKLSVDNFETKIHRDDVNPAVAGLLPVALRVVAEDQETEPLILAVAEALRAWDIHYNSADPAYPVAMALSDCAIKAFRMANLSERFAFGWAGVSNLARQLAERFAQDQATPKDEAVRHYLILWLRLTGEQMRQTGQPLNGKRDPQPHTRVLRYQRSEPINLPAVNPALDVTTPPMQCGQVQTIWSQPGNAYVQIVDLSDVDNSRTVQPPGVSEDPDSPFYLNQLDLWLSGKTRPAPLSREKIEATATSRLTLTTQAYVGPEAPAARVVTVVPAGGRLILAIPPTPDGGQAAESQPERRGLADEMFPR